MSVFFKDKITGLWKRAAANLIYAAFPVGSIVAYGGSSDVDAPAGCMYCHGQALNANDYPDLYDVIGTKFGVGDGSTGSFNLPDMRESVPVGAGTNALNTIATHDVYTVGQFKDDQLQDHTHKNSGNSTPAQNYLMVNGYPSGTLHYGGSGTGQLAFGKVIGVDSGRKGTTTHGKRTGVEYIIRVVK